MADKKYKLIFEMTQGEPKEVEFTVPQGEPGDTPVISKEELDNGNVVKFTVGGETTSIFVEDGVSPSVSVTATDNGNQVVIIDKSETPKIFDVENGVDVSSASINADGELIITLSNGKTINAGDAKGADGKSCHAQLVPDGNDGYYLNIINDGEEAQQAYISNGKTPLIYVKDITGGHKVSFYVNEVEVGSFEVMDGEKGDQGDSPAVSVEQIEGGHRVTIGGETFNVMDGTGGGGSGATYIANGTRYGSLRTVGAAAESGDYKLGLNSFAEGDGTKAPGNASHAEGKGTISASAYQHVEGAFNIADEEIKYIHIAGNGDNYSTRSNAHTLDWDGNAWFAGKVFIGGTGQDDPNAKELGTGGGSEMTDLETIALLAENGLLPTITDGSGRILTDAKNTIMLRY